MAPTQPATREGLAARAGRFKVAVLCVLCVAALSVPVAIGAWRESLYNSAVDALNRGQFSSALSVLGQLGDYRDAKQKVNEAYISQGESLVKAGKYEQGIALLEKAGAQTEVELARRASLLGARVGGYVWLGSYKGVSIRWRVLAMENDRALLISDAVLCNRVFHSSLGQHVWKTSSLRRWLNGTFVKQTFTTSELLLLLMNRLENDNNPMYGMEDGRATDDRVFLLDVKQAQEYFSDEDDRVACNLSGKPSAWWLRTVGEVQGRTVTVGASGAIDMAGAFIHEQTIGVRPAIWVKLPD